MTAPRLEARGLSFAYGARTVLSRIDLTIAPGACLVLVGPNGAGKTTLIDLLLGLRKPSAGEIRLDGAPLATYSRRALALRLAAVAQGAAIGFPFSVFELVLMSRYPRHLGLAFEDDEDRAAARQALADADVLALAERHVDELSGGERARVLLAAALAQETDTLLLDEPTAHLDLRHQYELVRGLRRLAGERTLVVALHDLGMAAAIATQVVMLADGQIAASGPPDDVLTPARIAAVYGLPSAAIGPSLTPNWNEARR